MPGIMRSFQQKVKNEGRLIAAMPQKAAVPAKAGLLAGAQLEALVTASLTEDLAALKTLASRERKEAMKRETLIPKYGDYVERLKAAGSRHELLGYWLVWLFDAGMLVEACEYAAWGLDAGLKLPERFQSDIHFFIASQVIEWAEKEFNAGRSPEPFLSDQYRRQTAEPEKWNLPDELAARYHRLRGLMAEKDGNLALAEAELQAAMDLGAKVKTALANVRKMMGQDGAAAQQEGDGGDTAPATE